MPTSSHPDAAWGNYIDDDSQTSTEGSHNTSGSPDEGSWFAEPVDTETLHEWANQNSVPNASMKANRYDGPVNDYYSQIEGGNLLANSSEAETLLQLIHQNTDQFI